jgi:hypothetical protein
VEIDTTATKAVLVGLHADDGLTVRASGNLPGYV